MEIIFDKQYLSELYYTGECKDKQHRYQPQIITRYIRRIELLESAKTISELYQYKSLNYEILKGEKQGISSIRVNRQYRIEFTVTTIKTETTITICNIIELSKHYK
ncbi:MAG: type II toxin-antitoxin system RelE/ParE family toxin [Bacteroidales bacterium]|jgi:toxin HigB-1|nr:type II toxin-antitoxin system RelE/ParE family toxin [Bacteroidales bacterium]MCI1733939.1 type II toxin-antitoxin system RelE/ParE family toxin [Bacteroidales bacterium]